MALDKNGSPILIPTDFSSHSEAALEFAVDLARLLDAPLIVLHVVHDPGDAPGFYAGKKGNKGVERMQDVAAEMMEAFLREFADKYPNSKPGGKTTTMLRVGLPVAQILDTVEKVDPRMVVMGSLGRTGLKHMLIGSKAEQIVRLCPVPVTIVKSKPIE